MAFQAQQIVDSCASQIYSRVIENTGDYDPLLEQATLGLILSGLMARASRRGIAWLAIQNDAMVALQSMTDLPATDVKQ